MRQNSSTPKGNNNSSECSQSNKAYEFILEKIKNNEWVPGQKIFTEKELCEELNLSRISVRTALDKLAVLGIIEKRKGAGTFVSEIDLNDIVNNIVPLMALKPTDLLDVLRFRLYFEPANVKEFMKNHSPEDIEALKESFERMKQNIQDNEDFNLADIEFHKIIARGTKNPIVISIYEMLTGILEASLDLSYGKIGAEICVKFHEGIIDAIEQKDKDMATLLMTRHIEENIERVENPVVSVMSKQPA